MLDVTGMKCGGCSASVKRILLSSEGVQHAAVNLLTETAVIKLRPAETSAAEAAELLTNKVGLCAKHYYMMHGMLLQDSKQLRIRDEYTHLCTVSLLGLPAPRDAMLPTSPQALRGCRASLQK